MDKRLRIRSINMMPLIYVAEAKSRIGMPRLDSSESTRAIWGVLAAHLENAPVTRWAFVDSRDYHRPTRITRRHVFGSGSARLGLSQKGDLPSGDP